MDVLVVTVVGVVCVEVVLVCNSTLISNSKPLVMSRNAIHTIVLVEAVTVLVLGCSGNLEEQKVCAGGYLEIREATRERGPAGHSAAAAPGIAEARRARGRRRLKMTIVIFRAVYPD